MAAVGGLLALIGGVEATTKKALTELINAAFGNLRIGPVDSAKAENFAAFKLTSTTAASTGEFSVLHGIGRTPYLAIPVVDLSVVGAKILPLTVTRAADMNRMYFKTEAGSTSAVFSLYVE